jgi:hypothetical protein
MLLFPWAMLSAQVTINEISICNVNGELDPNYDYTGWIELYNNSDAAIQVRDLYFSDEAATPLKYQIDTDRVLPAKGYAVVWLNDEIINAQTGYALDTDADDGGFLSVSAKDGTLYDSMNYTEQFPNVSYGRPADGDVVSPLVYFIENTFGKSNNGSAIGTETLKTPAFSAASGFYDKTLSVSITCPTEGAAIYYTTDSSEPTTQSTLYTGAIPIEKTTVLRARAFKDGLLKGLIGTATYLINERKPASLPVAFLTCDPVNLYDDMIGIYCVGTNGIVLTVSNPKANYNQDWTRWAHFEYTNGEGVNVNQSIGIGINGNATRGYAQKSFKLKARTRYGENRFDVPIFPTREGLRYKSILLRNGGQYNTSIQLIHDACLQSLADVTPLDYQASTPVVVYLNGAYWGIYNMRERKNEDMIYSHYGSDDTTFDMIEFNWRAVVAHGNKTRFDSFEQFVNAADFTKEEDYAQACALMDIDNFLYYMAIEILLKNDDWPNNNQLMFSSNLPGGRWKWILQDLDKCLVDNKSVNKLKEMISSTSTLLSTKLIVKLLANEAFKDEYITVQSLVAGSVYAPARFETRLGEFKKAIQAEYPYYQTQWPEQGKNNLETFTKYKIGDQKQACSQIYDHLKENFALGNIHALTINSNQAECPVLFNKRQIPVLPYEGKWFEGKSLLLQAPLYHKKQKFAFWEITDSQGNQIKQTETTLNLLVDKDMSVKAVYEPAEMVGRSGLFINELSANNAAFVDNAYKYEDWVEIYNASDEAIDLAGYYVSNDKNKPTMSQLGTTDAKSSTIPAGGYGIIWCSKKPERGVMHTNFKLAKEGGSVYLSRLDEQNQVVLVDSVCYAYHEETNSFGRYPDGAGTLYLFGTTTFKKMNQYSMYSEVGYTEDFPLVTAIQTPDALDRPTVYMTTNHQLYVHCPEGRLVKIVSLNGALIGMHPLTQEHTYIDLASLPQGLYVVIVESAKERWGYKIVR